LLREEALPDILQEKTVTELAELIRNNPDKALASIRSALSKAAAAQGLTLSQVRIVVAVDQMEELFTTEKDQAFREALIRMLAALASSGLAWVIGTMRADFFHRCSEIAGFSSLKDGLGSYEL